MQTKTQDAIELIISEVTDGDIEFLLSKVAEVGGEDAEKAIQLIALLSQA